MFIENLISNKKYFLIKSSFKYILISFNKDALLVYGI